MDEASLGSRIVRRRARLEIVRNDRETEIFALVTASPFQYDDTQFVLLILEDITEIVELKRLIPICSVCKRVRDDKESWLRMECYFKDRLDIDFSHGYCPECLEKEMSEVEKLNLSRESPIFHK